MKHPRIISIGEVLWDLFPYGERFGGAPANFAYHAARLGAEVTMVSAVGDDARGQAAIGILGRFAIDTSLAQVAPEQPTGTVGIELDGAGKPRFTIHENAAWDHVTWSPDLAAKISEANAVYFGTLGQRSAVSRATIRRALDVAKAAGVLRILDINLRPPFFSPELIRKSIEHADVLKLSDDELEAIVQACEISAAKDATSSLRDIATHFELEAIVMTRGAEGALFVTAENTIEQPGIPAEIVDTVGAGDSFTAAFLVGLLRGEEMRSVLQHACEVASAVCSQPGAIPEVPAFDRKPEAGPKRVKWCRQTEPLQISTQSATTPSSRSSAS
jgi:fructokinase